MKIYLDNNIFVSIEDKEIELNELKNIFGSNAKFVYSYIHVLELLEAKKDFEQLKKTRFKTINEVTGNYYVFQETNHNSTNLTDFKIERPEFVLNIIRNYNFINDEFRKSLKRFDLIDRKKLIEFLSIDTRRISNYSEEEVIKHINKALTDNLYLPINTFLDLTGDQLSSRIRFLFNLLDYLGYWKDKNSHKANLARLYDASHAYYASECDIFLSNDTRACKKTKVAFELYGIKTNVFDWKKIKQ